MYWCKCRKNSILGTLRKTESEILDPVFRVDVNILKKACLCDRIYMSIVWGVKSILWGNSMNDNFVDSRARVLLLAKLLYEKTDESHGLTVDQIIEELQRQGMKSERKTLYKDIECLIQLGHDIVKYRRGREVLYHIGARQFEMAELRILIDSVQASHFLTPQKTKRLIKKLERVASVSDAKTLESSVYISGQRKATNESIYYSVNDLHLAIVSDCKVSFQYFQWDVKKKEKLRHEGKAYEVSPWAMLFDHENYYLVAYDSAVSQMRHYRVDKMKNLTILEERRSGKEEFEQYDMSTFTQSIFGMFNGDTEHIILRVSNDLAGVMIDRFGKEIEIKDEQDETFILETDVRVSDQFLGWIIAIGDGVEVLAPESVRDRLKSIGDRLRKQY